MALSQAGCKNMNLAFNRTLFFTDKFSIVRNFPSLILFCPWKTGLEVTSSIKILFARNWKFVGSATEEASHIQLEAWEIRHTNNIVDEKL